VRVTNDGARPARQVELVVHGAALADGAARLEIGDLPPGRSARRLVRVCPDHAGEDCMDLNLQFAGGTARYAATGQWDFITFPAQMDLDKLVVTIQNTIHAGDRVGGVIQESGLEELSQLVRDRQIRDEEQLFQRTYGAGWCEIPLEFHQTGRAEPMEAVRPFWLPGGPVDRASVRVRRGGRDERLLILGKQTVDFGRSSKHDVRLVLLPKTPDNLLASSAIHRRRPHFSLSLDGEGLWIVDAGSTMGTNVDDRRVDRRHRLAVGAPSELEVGGVLSLRVTPLADRSDRPAPAPARYSRLGAPDALWTLSERVGVRGVMIERVNNLPGREHYLVLYRWVDLAEVLPVGAGSAPDALGDGVRLLRLGEQIWMHPVGGGEPVAVNDKPLAGTYACCLDREYSVRVGPCEALVGEFRQLRGDEQDG
jgi:hypothetical protein